MVVKEEDPKESEVLTEVPIQNKNKVAIIKNTAGALLINDMRNSATDTPPPPLKALNNMTPMEPDNELSISNLPVHFLTINLIIMR